MGIQTFSPKREMAHNQLDSVGKSLAGSLKEVLENTVAKIEVVNNKYRIRLPRALAPDSRRRINTRLEVSEENFNQVLGMVWQIEQDIQWQCFDSTLEKYYKPFQPFNGVPKVVKLTVAPTVVPIQAPIEDHDLLSLWCKYAAYMKPQLAVTTYEKDYQRKYKNHIKALPTVDLEKSVEIRDYLLANLSLNAAKRVLTYISACCSWAMKSKLIVANPFDGMGESIKKPKKDTDSINPFTATERDVIIQAFKDHPHYKHYASFVEFLFKTGARTGEVVALKWKHITKDCSTITFAESYNSSLKVTKGTKTGKVRKFPCNDSLRKFLLEIRPTGYEPEQYVFTSPTGLPISNTRFSNQCWKGCKSGKKTYKGIVTELADQGKIGGYRCFYNTRHTAITLMLEGGLSVSQVAKLVGNSPAIILEHYASSLLKISIPEF